MRYDYVILVMILIVCMATLCILLKILKKISIRKGSILCEFSIYELFLINDCLNDRGAGFALDIEETSTLLCFDVVDLDKPVQKELRQAIADEGIVLYEKV